MRRKRRRVVNPLKIIRCDVGVDDGALALFAGLRVTVLHADDAGEAFRVEVAEYIPVVDLARRGLASAGIVTDLDVGDLVPGGVDVRDQVAFRDLLMVRVEQDLARWAADGFADHVRLRRTVE